MAHAGRTPHTDRRLVDPIADLTKAVENLTRTVEGLRGDLAALHALAPAQGSSTPRIETAANDAAATVSVPTFSSAAQAYTALRREASGGTLVEESSLKVRFRTFVDVLGNRPIDRYEAGDLQLYVNRMKAWPASANRRARWRGLTVPEVLERNRALGERPIARKTLEHGYVASIRAAMAWGCEREGIPNPFAKTRVRWPTTLAPSVAREPIGHDVLNRTFELGVASGYLDRAMLPLLAYLTGRRIGLLCHLQGADLRRKDGVWIAQTAGIVRSGEGSSDEGWRRVPYKTASSASFFVLHRVLERFPTHWSRLVRCDSSWLWVGASHAASVVGRSSPTGDRDD